MHNAIELSPRFAACALLSLSSAACSTGDPASTWAGTVVDSAGVEIVQNPMDGIWQSGEGWTLEEVLSIGETIGDEAYRSVRSSASIPTRPETSTSPTFRPEKCGSSTPRVCTRTQSVHRARVPGRSEPVSQACSLYPTKLWCRSSLHPSTASATITAKTTISASRASSGTRASKLRLALKGLALYLSGRR